MLFVRSAVLQLCPATLTYVPQTLMGGNIGSIHHRIAKRLWGS